MSRVLRVGTRGSQLALWQARLVAERLREASGVHAKIVVIKTSGDRLAEAPLSEAGGKRLFVKEIEDALLRRDVDLAVHSSKDMPVVLPDGLEVAAYLEREDAHDVLIQRRAGGDIRSQTGDHVPQAPIEQVLREMGPSPAIGTSSVRRTAQLRRLLPGGRFEPIRGNLDTRLRKLDRGDHDVLVLAAAGVRRLGFADRISATLPFDVCVPAPGQGAIALEVRADDPATGEIVRAVDHRATAVAATAERAVVARLGGGCQTPVGVVAEVADGTLAIRGIVASLGGDRLVRATGRGELRSALDIANGVADRLIADGALEILGNDTL